NTSMQAHCTSRGTPRRGTYPKKCGPSRRVTNATRARSPRIELVPLPPSAQFLNVIESVFSGMARAIIHNSDYPSVKAASEAIDRYFDERNRHFEENPRRAGKKIWGKERTEAAFDPTNNCKDPAYR